MHDIQTRTYRLLLPCAENEGLLMFAREWINRNTLMPSADPAILIYNLRYATGRAQWAAGMLSPEAVTVLNIQHNRSRQLQVAVASTVDLLVHKSSCMDVRRQERVRRRSLQFSRPAGWLIEDYW